MLEEQAGARPCFTPHGILQNPYHAWPNAPSGVVRSVSPIGLEWVVGFRWIFTEQEAKYVASLKIGVNINGNSFYQVEDFAQHGISICSELHSKNVISYDWEYAHLNFSSRFFLAGENALCCLTTIENNGARKQVVILHGIMRLLYRDHSLQGRHLSKPDGIAISIPPLHFSLMLGASEMSLAQKFADSESSIEKLVLTNDLSSLKEFDSKSQMYGMGSYRIELSAGEHKTIVFCLTRVETGSGTTENLREGIQNAEKMLAQKIAEDRQFWAKSPRLTGGWPQHWINGFIYDYETLRTCVHPPAGVFHHPWDIMQVNWPRNVVAETSIDMLMLSYADMELAKTVILGLYKDALAANVPCVHADGTFNMVAGDGSRCGTSPAWCFPFYDYLLIYLRMRDKEWLGQIYPYWSEYLRWWLENRTDEEGWLHYKCSWESGEDLAPRFGTQSKGSDSIEYIGPSDLQAVVAHAAKTMSFYGKELALEEAETKYWEDVHQRYNQKLLKMWRNGWFHDYDAKAQAFTQYKDPLHLAPVFLSLATRAQILEIMGGIDKKFEDFRTSTLWSALIWPSFTFSIVEALRVAGELDLSLKKYQAKLFHQLVDRVYAVEDARFKSADSPLPGVSIEHWGHYEIPKVSGAVEAYGWGALATLIIIRHVIGYLEDQPHNENSFLLSPNFDETQIREGKIYGIENLHFQGITFAIKYEVSGSGLLVTTLAYKAEKPCGIRVMDRSGITIYQDLTETVEGKVKVQMKNMETYKIIFLRS